MSAPILWVSPILSGPSDSDSFPKMSHVFSSRRFRALLVGRPLLVGSLLVVSGCAKPHFPHELFTVHAEGADYPVMVSKPAKPMAGRAINAQSGTHHSASSQSYSAGNATVTVTTTRSAVSEQPAANKLMVQVGRSDKWLQFEGAEYYGEDASGYGWSQADRTLSIQGKVGK